VASLARGEGTVFVDFFFAITGTNRRTTEKSQLPLVANKIDLFYDSGNIF
jgi:hypothetical protein